MITRTGPLFVSSALAVLAADHQDMIRFNNGDQLRGRFISLHEGPAVKWLREDLAEPAEFKTSSIRQIVLNQGQARELLRDISHVELANKDRLPGTPVALDDKQLTLDTEYAGIIHVPRTAISMIAPNPLGGRLHYSGPFAADEWQLITASPHDEPSAEEQAAAPAAESWQFTGSSWIWSAKNPQHALARPSGIPDNAVIRFDLSWKNRLGLAIALHADFARPATNEANDNNRRRPFNSMDATSLARVFGNSNIIHLNSQYINCAPTRVDENGKIFLPRHANSYHNLRLGESGKATFEFRVNRNAGQTLLFVNDEFAAQWNNQSEIETHALAPLTGSGLGFIVMGNDCHIKISDIVICEWNGMPDSARSLQINEQDIVLMTNGTDRYAGMAVKLTEDGVLEFEGKYGEFKLPVNEIAEIRFARNRMATAAESNPPNVLVRTGPFGAISGSPIRSQDDSIELLNPCIGKIRISLKPVTLIDFNARHIIIDDWSHEF
jgi:hypothetical protein